MAPGLYRSWGFRSTKTTRDRNQKEEEIWQTMLWALFPVDPVSSSFTYTFSSPKPHFFIIYLALTYFIKIGNWTIIVTFVCYFCLWCSNHLRIKGLKFNYTFHTTNVVVVNFRSFYFFIFYFYFLWFISKHCLLLYIV